MLSLSPLCNASALHKLLEAGGMRKRHQPEGYSLRMDSWHWLAKPSGSYVSVFVSTDGLHAYTRMLTSSHPTRIVKQ